MKAHAPRNAKNLGFSEIWRTHSSFWAPDHPLFWNTQLVKLMAFNFSLAGF